MKKWEVIWSAFAENQLDSIFEYYSFKADAQIARSIIINIILSSDKLLDNPYLGPVEILLEGRSLTYRYLVVNHFKLIYSVDEINQFIKISDVFDTRQNPTKMNRNN